MPKLGLISLGCAKNLVDSEHMLARLRDAGWEITEDMTEADVGVVNTCGFIESAKTEAIENILEACRCSQGSHLLRPDRPRSRGRQTAGCAPSHPDRPDSWGSQGKYTQFSFG